MHRVSSENPGEQGAQKSDSILDMPWKACVHVSRLLVLPFARIRFALAGVDWRSGWKVFGLPVIQRHRQSSIVVGDHLDLRSTFRSNPLAPAHPVVISTRGAGASIQIGDDFGMTGGSIVAATRITIGDRVTVGANCVITDTDFHPLDPGVRAATPVFAATAPVEIGDDVFIGMHSLVLKGVTIGARSVIGASSVVTGDVPPDVIAAGNPAQVIRRL